MLYSHTFDFLILRGIDYENDKNIENGIRLVKFAGCTGTVIISSVLNDRESVIYSFSQAYITKSGEINTFHPFFYNPDSSIIII